MNSEGGKPGNVLTVNGNYTGNNGLMTFNATLGGDNSPTDKMNVKGDTQGNTRVRVDNIGGVGAQTVNGIKALKPPFYPRSRISQRLSRTADKMCFQIDFILTKG
ncbi:autotransporter outer membrane beta-barrel domain-containing protein [Escherichia coli]|nr:autotransporter outer membrane beta-barrel domain-containing protein [Escherichia coli]EKM9178634.1 autotransporter outer membrane beta-barrel domain-containing protein [Escherichia coli]